MMTKITGAGCSLGGVAATYLAVSDPLTAALSASLLYNRAGEVADTTSHGPGSFQVAFLDALWNVTAEQVAESEYFGAVSFTFPLMRELITVFSNKTSTRNNKSRNNNE